MKYFSTRGGERELSFEETVLTGLAPNGGLYIPVSIPQLPPAWKTEWKDYSFVDLSVAVLSLYISSDEMSQAELRELVIRSYAGFRHPEVTPLVKLSERKYVLELWHGPTWAFKDVALQFLGNLFEFFLKRRNKEKVEHSQPASEKLTVVGATSGDTGSAAIYGLRGKSNISIFILHPKGRVSPIQEAQMTTVTDANVYNLAVKGSVVSQHDFSIRLPFIQDVVKTLFGDSQFNAKHRLGAVNSINWARILAQTVYYFSAYFHARRLLGLSENEETELQFVVPTGNFGDILAGYYAKKMGLPMTGKLGVATNANDILTRFWRTGRYEKMDSSPIAEAAPSMEPAAGSSDGKQATDSSGVKETLSPAMDILVSSNFERLLWYLAFENVPEGEGNRREKAGGTVNEWMLKMKNDGRVEVPTAVLEAARRDFCAERVSDEETLETIRSHYTGTPTYVVDPHTAVGLHAASKMAGQNGPNITQIILSTAHPAKFSEAVSKALQSVPNFSFDKDVMPEEFKGLLQKERRVVDVEKADPELVKKVIESRV
ncbi:tryptophan synthase beta subunit-like PLP-dependent enzyme [Dendrothele bispora CBS 962.96]|uniref:threonine synthase n=1 Tax=Dendrothele bispora (strain CBS 962.96) TaxID=1314807 RepID=A0A4S8MRM4_DENBC|nr:tryptophan synthase beta subunit-like PLP-dependent enzyme [Dendrothele bispora CBS 962.96]